MPCFAIIDNTHSLYTGMTNLIQLSLVPEVCHGPREVAGLAQFDRWTRDPHPAQCGRKQLFAEALDNVEHHYQGVRTERLSTPYCIGFAADMDIYIYIYILVLFKYLHM